MPSLPPSEVANFISGQVTCQLRRMSGAGTSWVNVETRNGQLGAEYRRWGSLLVKVNRSGSQCVRGEGWAGWPLPRIRGGLIGVGTSVVLNKPETRFGGPRDPRVRKSFFFGAKIRIPVSTGFGLRSRNSILEDLWAKHPDTTLA